MNNFCENRTSATFKSIRHSFWSSKTTIFGFESLFSAIDIKCWVETCGTRRCCRSTPTKFSSGFANPLKIVWVKAITILFGQVCNYRRPVRPLRHGIRRRRTRRHTIRRPLLIVWIIPQIVWICIKTQWLRATPPPLRIWSLRIWWTAIAQTSDRLAPQTIIWFPKVTVPSESIVPGSQY